MSPAGKPGGEPATQVYSHRWCLVGVSLAERPDGLGVCAARPSGRGPAQGLQVCAGASHTSREPHVGAGWESRPRVSQRSCEAPGGVTRALQVSLALFSPPLQCKQPQTPELTASSAPTEPYLQKQAPVRYGPGLQLPSPWPRLGFGGPDLSCVALSRGGPL